MKFGFTLRPDQIADIDSVSALVERGRRKIVLVRPTP